jgi:hypothetical protein
MPTSPAPQAAPPQRLLALKAAVQLWFPIAFSAAMALAYLGAFHRPVPHDVPVAVAGPPAQTRPLAAGLQRRLGDAFDVRLAASPAQARADVLDRSLVAAYVPGPGRPRLEVASAASPSAAEAASAAFGAVAASDRQSLQVTDLRPPQPGDYRGTSPFYLVIAWSIGGYMSAIVLGAVATAMAGLGLTLAGRTRLALLVPTTLISSALGVLVAGPLLHALDGHAPELIAIGWLYACAIGLVGLGLHYFLGRQTTAAMVFLFVVLNFPSAGGAYDPRLQPWIYRVLHDVWPGAAAVDATRDVVYFGGDGAWPRLAVIALWALAGLVLLAAGVRRGERPVRPGAAAGDAELEVAEGAAA